MQAANDEHALLQRDLLSLESENGLIHSQTKLMQERTIAAGQQKQDFSDAVKLTDDSVAKLQSLVVIQDKILSNGKN